MIEIQDILAYLKAKNILYEYHGSQQCVIEGFCALSDLKPHAITWIKKLCAFNMSTIDPTLEILIVTQNDATCTIPKGYHIIQCNNPKAAFFSILTHFWKKEQTAGIAETSVVKTDKIGENVSIGQHCVICAEAEIGDNVVIENNVVIQCATKIGNNTILHSGVVIGADGFGYFKDDNGRNSKVPHFGGVLIGEDVEIGANACIDRGTLSDTIIYDNVKIDNLVHVGHNVRIDENCLVIAQAMLAGSCHIERNAYIAPGVLVMNQITVGENSFAGMGTVILKDVPPNKVVIGVPAKVLRDNVKEESL